LDPFSQREKVRMREKQFQSNGLILSGTFECPLSKARCDHLKHSISVGQYIVVPEPEHFVASGFK